MVTKKQIYRWLFVRRGKNQSRYLPRATTLQCTWMSITQQGEDALHHIYTVVSEARSNAVLQLLHVA